MTEDVPIESVRPGDPFTDTDGQYYKCLESMAMDGGGVAMELEHHHQGECQVVEKTYPAGYTVGRSVRHVG